MRVTRPTEPPRERRRHNPRQGDKRRRWTLRQLLLRDLLRAWDLLSCFMKRNGNATRRDAESRIAAFNKRDAKPVGFVPENFR
jgi:hypothetical protein